MMESKFFYLQLMETHLKKWRLEIEKLRLEATLAQAKAHADFYELMEAADHSLIVADRELQALSRLNHETAEARRESAERALKQVEEAIKKARAKYINQN